MYKILIKYDIDKLNLWMPYGTTTNSTTGKSEFTEFETDNLEVLKEEIKKITSKIGYAEIRIVSDIVFDIEIDIENNRESGEQP